VTEPRNGNTRMWVRRRPTRRHRRNRLIRRCLAFAVLGAFAVAVSGPVMRFLSSSASRARNAFPQRHTEVRHSRASAFDQLVARTPATRPIYPYSVVPGGVNDPAELKWVAEHDPIVAAHYAGFDYERAHVVRLTLARTVYISYRIGNHIYWTSHRITLKKGETLITDGRMTARTRCANRVEETPQQKEASAVEPTAAQLDQPERSGQGTAVQAPPVAYQSALINRPQAPELGAAGPLALYNPFEGGSFISVTAALPEELCSPVKKKSSGAEIEEVTGKKKKVGGCGESGGGGTVPEPGTWILFASGLGLMVWRFRRQFSNAN
jgi:hypothetical protein